MECEPGRCRCDEPEGFSVVHQSSDMYPQLAGWYACHDDDENHDHCLGPCDSRHEAVQRALKKED